MTLDALIMLSGAFIATLPFLGLPNSWDTVLFFVAGVFVIGLGITVRRREKDSGSASSHAAPQHFVDHMPRPQAHEHGQS